MDSTNRETRNILYVDDDAQNLFLFRTTFEQQYDIYTAGSGPEALDILAHVPIQVIFADQRMPEMNGIQLLEKITQDYPETIRVLVTGYTDIDVVIDAINRGSVYRYISKPWDNKEILYTIKNALEIHELKNKNLSLTASLDVQNTLLRKQVDELNFLNELNLELKGVKGFSEAITQSMHRLLEKLGADCVVYCERSESERTERTNAEFVISLPRPPPPGAEEIIALINTQCLEFQNAQVLNVAPGQIVHWLPLTMQSLDFGYLAFLYTGIPEQSDFLFSQAVSNVLASVLNSLHLHKAEMEKEKFFVLGRTASMIVHDLKGPMTTMSGFVNLIDSEQNADKRNAYCKILNKEISRLVEMIDELLSFSKGRSHLKISPINLKDLFTDTFDLFKVAYKTDGIQFQLNLNDHEQILGDAKKLSKVFINLLTNAREALNGQKGDRKVWVSTAARDSEIEIRVGDNGRPIPADILPRLFDPFFSFQKDNGTGLGLTICRNIVEEHEGTIQASSLPDCTEFVIQLPRKPSSVQVNRSRSPQR